MTMIKIPAGHCLMGSPPSEPQRRKSEGPQHQVNVGEFLMAQTPITQAQWRAVATLPQVYRTLKPYPSRYMERDSPVDLVNWFDAMEFCSRLSQLTGRHYTLPSEAQWEYACRAGTSTPFAFGATITPELANYNGESTYADGPKGINRGKTTAVGSFPANAWGMQDMHGTVWEWCLDHWHDSYEGAPSDGSAWLDQDAGENYPRLLRGGSWINDPRNCRSASREHVEPGNTGANIGFRVVCLLQDAGKKNLRPLRGGSWFDNPSNCRSAARDHDEPGEISGGRSFRVVCLGPLPHQETDGHE